MRAEDILKFAVERGMLNMLGVQDEMAMEKRKEYLEKHPYKIWKGKDEKWRTYLPDKQHKRILKKCSSREDIERAIIEYWKEQAENPTVEEAFNEWNDWRLELNKISQSTHIRNKQVFARHYSEFGKKHIKSLTPEEFTEFLENQVYIHNLTEKAFSNLKTITRGFLKRAKKKKLINFDIENIFYDIEISEKDFRKVIKEDSEEVFSEEEMPLVIDYLKTHPDMSNLGILLMFVTGIRVGELVTLKYSDFDGNVFHIRRTETRCYDESTKKYKCEVKETPKTEAGLRQVIIPFDYCWIIKRLRHLNPFGEYVFMKNGQRIHTHSIRTRLYRICNILGIPKKSPHKIRKTYGSILLDNGIDSCMITGQMGHTDIACTEKYYHRNRKNLDKKAVIISNLPEFCAK